MSSFTPYASGFTIADWRENPEEGTSEDFSPEVEALLKRLDVPIEILDFDYGTDLH